jgi:hypothetical protein
MQAGTITLQRSILAASYDSVARIAGFGALVLPINSDSDGTRVRGAQ